MEAFERLKAHDHIKIMAKYLDPRFNHKGRRALYLLWLSLYYELGITGIVSQNFFWILG